MSLHNVAVSSLSKLRDNLAELKRSWAAALSTLSFISAAAFAGLAVTGQDFVVMLLGEKWVPVGPLLCIFAVRGIAQGTERTLGWLQVVAGRSDRWMRWGLVPWFARDAKSGPPSINARAETVATTRIFREAFQRRRCLIVADGFYEWRQVGGERHPYFIRLRSRRPFAFAGVWERWKPPDGDPLVSCAIVTCAANGVGIPRASLAVGPGALAAPHAPG